MDPPLNGPGSYPGHKNGNRFNESYHSSTIPVRWIANQLEKRKKKSCSQQRSNEVLRKVAISSPNTYLDFSGHLIFDHDNVD